MNFTQLIQRPLSTNSFPAIAVVSRAFSNVTVTHVALGVFALLGLAYWYYQNQKKTASREVITFEKLFCDNTLTVQMLDSRIISLTKLLRISSCSRSLRESFVNDKNYKLIVLKRMCINRAIRLSATLLCPTHPFENPVSIPNGVGNLIRECIKIGSLSALQTALQIFKSKRNLENVRSPTYSDLVRDIVVTRAEMQDDNAESEALQILEVIKKPKYKLIATSIEEITNRLEAIRVKKNGAGKKKNSVQEALLPAKCSLNIANGILSTNGNNAILLALKTIESNKDIKVETSTLLAIVVFSKTVSLPVVNDYRTILQTYYHLVNPEEVSELSIQSKV